MTDLNTVLIVGGGIGGMSLAIRLRNKGVAVDLVEIDTVWRAVGAGLTLNGATLQAFRQIGVLEEMDKHAHLHGGRRLHDTSGKILMDVPGYRPKLDDVSAWGGILRPTLHKILSEEVTRLGTTVRLGVTIDALDQHDDVVDVVFSDGSAGAYGLVVGADGLHSKVRGLIMPNADRPRFTGQGCWRAVFDRPQEVDTTWIYMGEPYAGGLNPISEDEMYMYLLESVPTNPWREPADWPDLLRERMTHFGGMIGDLAKTVGADNSINYRPLESVILPPPWHVGRVVLMGDACHATTPHAGYGAGLAAEDAVILSDYLVEDRPIDARLQAYVDRRYARCKAVVEGSLRVGQLQIDGRPASEQAAASADMRSIIIQPV